MNLLTPEDVADQLDISPRAVMDLARAYAKGNPKGLRGAKILRDWRFTEEDIALFVESNRPPAPSRIPLPTRSKRR